MITVFDIETGPLPWDEIAPLLRDPSIDPATVLQDAALSPMTGRIEAIGILRDGAVHIYGNETGDDYGEWKILEQFWVMAHTDHKSIVWDKWKPGEPRWVGFNSHTFDLPFIAGRTAKLAPRGYGVPHWVKEQRWYHRLWCDLRDIWCLGQRPGHRHDDVQPPVRSNLDTICRFLGIAGKNGDGAHFSALWRDPATRPEAIAYLTNDLVMTAKLAARLLRINIPIPTA